MPKYKVEIEISLNETSRLDKWLVETISEALEDGEDILEFNFREVPEEGYSGYKVINREGLIDYLSDTDHDGMDWDEVVGMIKYGCKGYNNMSDDELIEFAEDMDFIDLMVENGLVEELK